MAASGVFEKRERAAEEVYFRQEERLTMLKRLEEVVHQGKLDASVLASVRAATSPDVHHSSSVEVEPGVFRDVPAERRSEAEAYVFSY